jgi:ribosome maturation factor RimP
MDKEELIERLKVLLSEFLSSSNLELVDLIYRREGRDFVLRVLVDKPQGGITLDECTSLSRSISEMLDANNLPDESYMLEVSSPGLDRPLSSEKDFRRNLGRKVKFFLKEMLNGKLEWDGLIKEVNNNSVIIETGAQVLEIYLDKINKAKIII